MKSSLPYLSTACIATTLCVPTWSSTTRVVPKSTHLSHSAPAPVKRAHEAIRIDAAFLPGPIQADEAAQPAGPIRVDKTAAPLAQAPSPDSKIGAMLSGIEKAEADGRLDTAIPAAFDNRTAGWEIGAFAYDTGVPLIGKVAIRAGVYPEAPDAPFQGNVLYLQGLGDSMLNHRSLFSKLAGAGRRVIAFDYMGQGGSAGSMNDTRILGTFFRGLKISTLAENVYKRLARPDGVPGKKRVVMGWSTGGLAAYEMARRGAADAVVLIAPGIHPKIIAGDKLRITLESLTGADYSKEPDPHVDPIRPTSPLLTPLFAANLLTTAFLSRRWTIAPETRGLVLLGGDDWYVKSEKTLKTLERNAPHFRQVYYDDARHEVHNERREIREDAEREILDFLD